MEPYVLTATDLADLTIREIAWGSCKFLPKREQIPEDFYRGNVYTQLIEAIYFEDPLPVGRMEIRPMFQVHNIVRQLQRLVISHLRCIEPVHEHKIAGVSYAVSIIAYFSLLER